MALAAITVLIAGVVAFRYVTANPANPSEILAQAMEIDPETSDRYLQQMRATNLAILGREDLVRNAKLDTVQEHRINPTAVQIEIEFTRWNEVLPEIAASNRVVMIAEHHMSSATRGWICKTLPVFLDASFTHYCAEAITEPAFALQFRGGPNHQTGIYTADPKFGNLIRRALSMDMVVQGYDFRPFGHDTRENYAAEVITKLTRNSDNRILVHAGHSHVIKYVNENEYPMMASRFWEKSGIEPYTISQITDLHEPATRAFLLKKLRLQFGNEIGQSDTFVWQPDIETIRKLITAGFDIPMVDMIVVHPPSTAVGADSRLPNTGHHKELCGTWTRKQWPVVISAYREADSFDAIPLDQVLLKAGESKFNLWVPDDVEYVLRVFDVHGQLDMDSETQAAALDLR